MADYIATNAASSGVKLDKKLVKQLSRRSDRPGLIYTAQWLVLLALTGTAVWMALGTWWVIPAMLAYGTVLTVPSYSMSHECAHGTAFRTRWLNETMLWISSLLYFEEPYHRRFSHASHHTYTWMEGKDSQMPFDTPMGLKEWFLEVTGIGLFIYESPLYIRNALGRFSDEVRRYTPESELPKLKWGARACLAIYGSLAAVVLAGYWWPVIFILIPRLVGGPIMLLFTLIQHVEMQENTLDLRDSTRSFRTNWLGRFLYMNMNNHIEHHLYPMVPFHQLPELNKAVKDQLPEPDPGFFRTNIEVFWVVLKRSLRLGTKAPSIRQAPHMIAERGAKAERITKGYV
ncbi:fatty acid desaturase [Coralliovum pocilloporae]|uniref:fatty acid desaturase n=1 Tax=Coralliovum pocilloporae TaxID=3066369 RepID=UPI00330703A5